MCHKLSLALIEGIFIFSTRVGVLEIMCLLHSALCIATVFTLSKSFGTFSAHLFSPSMYAYFIAFMELVSDNTIFG